MKPIDIVVPYVNCWDPEWSKLASKYVGTIEYNRVRDLGTLRYFFRGVEKNMPWIHNVYLVLQSESQIPTWLNINHPKLKIVYHRDYIPKKYLPTFNSNVIELFYHRIKGLTRQFILANDDTIAIRPLKETDFFCDGKIVYGPSDRVSPMIIADESSAFVKTIKNTSIAAGVITGKYDSPFYKDYHLFMPYFKKVYRYCWKRYSAGIRHSFMNSRIRSIRNITHLLFYFVGRELDLYKIDLDYKPGLLRLTDGSDIEKIIYALEVTGSSICCLNDMFQLTSDRIASNTICKSLDHFLPNRSEFELF